MSYYKIQVKCDTIGHGSNPNRLLDLLYVKNVPPLLYKCSYISKYLKQKFGKLHKCLSMLYCFMDPAYRYISNTHILKIIISVQKMANSLLLHF